MKGWLKPRKIEEVILKEKDTDIEILDKNSEDVEASRFDCLAVPADVEIGGKFLERFEGRIVTRSAGYDHIDVEKAEELGVEVFNIPDYGCRSVAEHTFCLILSLSKSLPESLETENPEYHQIQGLELSGKTLGVVGAGNIGKEVLKLGSGFDMELLAYDPVKDQEAAEKIGYSYLELDELLKRSDIVSVHCPLIPSTENLLGSEQFELMEENLFINTARSGIVDTEALLDGLENGNVLKAGLDVVNDSYRSKLEQRSDVILTPHNAYNTEKANRRRVEKALKALEGDGNRVV